MEEQLKKVLTQMRGYDSAIQKNVYLRGLHDRNETLFHRLIVDNIEEAAPLIYTPTVGEVCQKFGDQVRVSTFLRGPYKVT